MRRMIILVMLTLLFVACTRVSVPKEIKETSVVEPAVNKTVVEEPQFETPEEVIQQTEQDIEVGDFENLT